MNYTSTVSLHKLVYVLETVSTLGNHLKTLGNHLKYIYNTDEE